MATIYKPPKKKDTRKKRGNNAEVHKCYNTTTWRRLRMAYLQAHPLCEKCMQKGIIKPAEEVHHIKEISHGQSLEDKQDLAFNSNNLMALCKQCHSREHKERRYGYTYKDSSCYQ